MALENDTKLTDSFANKLLSVILMWDKQKSGIDEVKLVIGYRAV
jgi:hypothetical protein